MLAPPAALGAAQRGGDLVRHLFAQGGVVPVLFELPDQSPQEHERPVELRHVVVHHLGDVASGGEADPGQIAVGIVIDRHQQLVADRGTRNLVDHLLDVVVKLAVVASDTNVLKAGHDPHERAPYVSRTTLTR